MATKTPSVPSQSKEYANQNTIYTIPIKNMPTKIPSTPIKTTSTPIKTTNMPTKRPSTPAKTPTKTPSTPIKTTSTPIKTPNAPTKTPSTSTKNTDLRCFVARQFLSRIYALFWCTIFKGLKMRWCTKKDKYKVWVAPFVMQCSRGCKLRQELL